MIRDQNLKFINVPIDINNEIFLPYQFIPHISCKYLNGSTPIMPAILQSSYQKNATPTEFKHFVTPNLNYVYNSNPGIFKKRSNILLFLTIKNMRYTYCLFYF